MLEPKSRVPPWDSLLLLAAVGTICLNQVADFDYWTHLAFGREYLLRGTIHIGEPFLASLQGQPHDSVEWPFRLLLVGVRSLASDWGVSAFVALTAVGACWLLSRLLVEEGGDGRRTLGLLLLAGAFFAARGRYLPRPEVLTNLLFCASILVALRWAERPRLSHLARILLLLAVWYPLHVTWSVGGGFVFLIMTLTPHSNFWRGTARTAGGAALAAAFVAGMLLSLGSLWEFARQVLAGMADRGQMGFIAEMRPLWEYPDAAIPHGLVAVVTLGLSWGGRTDRWRRLALWAPSLAVGLLAARNYSLSILLMTAAALTGIRSLPPIRLAGARRYARLSVAPAFAALVGGAVVSEEPVWGAGLYEGVALDDAASFVKAKGLPEPLFNGFEVGGSLDYWCRGRPPTFIDGRSLATPEHLRGFLDVLYGPKPLLALRDLGSKTVVAKALFRDSGEIYPFVFLLLQSPEWRLVRATDALVFVRADSLGSLVPLTTGEGWDFIGRETELLHRLKRGAPHLPYNRALVQLMKGNTREAAALFRSAVASQPAVSEYYRVFIELTRGRG